jgi:Excalibur calcium-binding domain
MSYFVFKGRSLLMSENNKQSVEKEKAGSNKQGKKPANNKNNNFPAGCLGCGCSTFLSIIIIGIIITHFISYKTEVEKKLTANSKEPSITKTINDIKEKENNGDVSQTETTEENDMSDINSSTQTLNTSNQPNEPKQPTQTESTTNNNLNTNTGDNISSNTSSTPASSGGNEYFANCTELRKVYPNGVPSDHPAYQSKLDRDKDNYACER